MKEFLVILTILLCSLDVFAQKQKNDSLLLNSPYPRDSARLFADGIISTNLNEYNITFSPDGNVVLYTIANNSSANRFYTILITKKKKGKWSKPEIASFSGQYSDADPYFEASGKSLYFISTRPLIAGLLKNDFDIWCVEYENGNFGPPTHLGNSINSANDELYPCVSSNGNLYFSRENDTKGYDLFVSKYESDQFQKPFSLGDSINTVNTEFDAFVAPDESYIIYTDIGSKDNRGSGDLYISYNKGNYWTKGKNLGNKVNTMHMEQCPMVSPDGKYLYFTSFKDSQPYKSARAMTTQEYITILNSPLNGLGNIFWISLDKKVFSP